MTRPILLIHGSGHGAWCWAAVVPALAALGREARAIDLPGHGDDPTPRATVTLAAYRDAILAALPDAPATLVGHSMGGYPITAAALAAPDRVARLIYLAAYVPEPGRTLTALRKDWPEQPLVPAIRPGPDAGTVTFDPDLARDLFYHDCPDPDAALARLTPQPTAPQSEALPSVPGTPRRYIVCAADRAVPPGRQRAMTRGWPAGHVAEIPTGHSPFLSDPATLARAIDALG